MPKKSGRRDHRLSNTRQSDDPAKRRTVGDARGGKLAKPLEIARDLQILKLYTRGKTPEQIALELNLLEATVERALKSALDKLSHQFQHAPPNHSFVRYASFQFGIIEKLQHAYDKFVAPPPTITDPNTQKEIPSPNKQNPQAAVASLRAQSDIMDKIYNRGIEFGIIQTTSEKSAEDILRAQPQDLTFQLKKEVTTLTQLIDHLSPKEEKPFVKLILKIQTDPNGRPVQTSNWKNRKWNVQPNGTRTLADLPMEPAQEQKNFIQQVHQETVTLTAELSKTSTEQTQEQETKEQENNTPQQPTTQWLIPPTIDSLD